jgi:hypothetical protein
MNSKNQSSSNGKNLILKAWNLIYPICSQNHISLSCTPIYKMKKQLILQIIFFLLFMVVGNVYAQKEKNDSLQTTKSGKRKLNDKKSRKEFKYNPQDSLSVADADTTAVTDTSKIWWTGPRKALFMSMAVPGLGQIYNKKYWKLPILYIGAALLTYSWITSQHNYQTFENAYSKYEGNTPPTFRDTLLNGLIYRSSAQLKIERDTYRRNRDKAIAGSIALYALNILDAYVDAHLKEFDVSPDLALSIKPFIYQNNSATFTSGINLRLTFKNSYSKKVEKLEQRFY